MKYKPNRDLPVFAREIKSTSPTSLAAKILAERNVKRSPQSITLWFNDHPEVLDQLNKELSLNAPTEEMVVDQSLFTNGNFAEVPSIKTWVFDMGTRRRKNKALHPEYIRTQVYLVRQLCQQFNKHPDRLTFKDAQEMFMALEKDATHSHWEQGERKAGMDTASFRRAMKDFLKSKNDPHWTKIGVGKPSGFGHYKDLFVEKDTLEKMLQHVWSKNFKVYVLDMLMFHNGIRLNACLTAQIKNFKQKTPFCTLKVVEKFRDEKTFSLAPKVSDLIATLIGERKDGRIFELDEAVASSLNGEALKSFCPEVLDKYGGHINPNHFWRHMCAQHLLRLTKRNSKVVAAIMQCTEQSLNESYGAATSEDVEAWLKEYLPQL